MSNLIAVVGESGTGKSTSLETLNPEETVIINVANKPLPFKGWKSKYKAGKVSEGFNLIQLNMDKMIDNCEYLLKVLSYINESRPEIRNIVVEDAQYLMAFAYMEYASQKGYEKFSTIAQIGFNPVNHARSLRDDLNIVFVYHAQEEEHSKVRKIKTVGKLVDNAITLEGMFTVVLHTDVSKDSEGNMLYRFITTSDGSTTSKSPKGMFETRHIPNDMQLVIDSMVEFFN